MDVPCGVRRVGVEILFYGLAEFPDALALDSESIKNCVKCYQQAQ